MPGTPQFERFRNSGNGMVGSEGFIEDWEPPQASNIEWPICEKCGKPDPTAGIGGCWKCRKVKYEMPE